MSGQILNMSLHRHEQATPASVWTIVHNLSGNGSTGIPIVDAFITVNSVVTKIIPVAVTIVDKNTVTLTFSEARSGYAVVAV